MLHIEAAYQSVFRDLGLASPEAIMEFFGGAAVKRPTGVTVFPADLGPPGRPGLPIFYKQYNYQPAALSFVGRASKARCEYSNYAVFRQLEIPCADRVAFGEQRDWLGRLRRAFIITRTIPEATTLLDFFKRQTGQTGSWANRLQRVALRRQLADLTRRIHRANFFHHDLFWRNLLVTSAAPAEPKLWWIDCPRGGFGWSWDRRRRLLKDLASLDKAASQLCSRTQRVAFIREYLEQKRLGPEGKRLIRGVLTYRKTRWPEDWKGR